MAKVDRPWTRKEEAALAGLVAAGVRYRAAAGVLGRSVSAVTTKAYHLGIRCGHAPYRHDATVRRLSAAGYCDWEIAIHLDVDRSRVAVIRKRLGLPAADRRQSGIAMRREEAKRQRRTA
jgi:hypothetical protein